MSKKTIELKTSDYSKLVALARRTLHIAYVWNDHNFDDPDVMAVETAEQLEINNFNEANDFLGSLPVIIEATKDG